MFNILPTLILAALCAYLVWMLREERKDKDSDTKHLFQSFVTTTTMLLDAHRTDIKDIISVNSDEREQLLNRIMAKNLEDFATNTPELPKKEEKEPETEVDLEDARPDLLGEDEEKHVNG